MRFTFAQAPTNSKNGTNPSLDSAPPHLESHEDGPHPVMDSETRSFFLADLLEYSRSARMGSFGMGGRRLQSHLVEK